jgi:hypothetical protein
MKQESPKKNNQRVMAQAVENPPNVDVEIGADIAKKPEV